MKALTINTMLLMSLRMAGLYAPYHELKAIVSPTYIINYDIFMCILILLWYSVWDGKLVVINRDGDCLCELRQSAGISTIRYSESNNFLIAGRDDGYIYVHSGTAIVLNTLCDVLI